MKSETVKVIVSPKSAELTIGLDRTTGTPGTVKIIGALYEAGTINVIRGGTIELWVNGLKKATTTTSISDGGRYHFDYTVGAGSYEFFTKFIGNDTYFPDNSPFVSGTYAKIATSASIDVNPTYGAPPLAVTILGMLYRDDTGGGLPGKLVDLFRNGVKLKSMVTKTTSPGQGAFEFHDTLTAQGGYEYYVYFGGDSKFEGCEAGEGATVDGDGNGNGDGDGVSSGLGLLILAALVLGDQK